MAYKITDECMNCGACVPECPNKAISEEDDKSVIDPDKCTECVGSFESSRCAEVCPFEAPVPDPKYKESKEQLLVKWKKLHPGEIAKVY